MKENSNYVNEIQSLDREKQEVRRTEDRIRVTEHSSRECSVTRIRSSVRRTEDRIRVTEHSLEELELRIRVVVRYMSDV